MMDFDGVKLSEASQIRTASVPSPVAVLKIP